MIELKSPRELGIMERAGKIAARLLQELEQKIRPGIRTIDLDIIATDFIKANEAVPAFKGYRGYPATICASVNEEVVHGIPGGRRLKSGDVISIDVGVKLEGYFADTARTFPVGEISRESWRLLHVTEDALRRAIGVVKTGVPLSEISRVIQTYVESNGFGVVRQFVGHGIGAQLHEEPQIPNFLPAQGTILKEGMVLAIEPMVTQGHYEVEILSDGWTAVTKDRSLAAHFEHSIAVTSNGARILTQHVPK